MTSARQKRQTVLAGAFLPGAALVAALVAGCSSGSPTASSASALTATGTSAASSSSPASSASSPAASPSSSPAASGASSAAANSSDCATRDLRASAGIAQGAAGSVYQVIDFTNISGAPCTLFGYPGVALAGGSPVTQIGAAASRSSVAAAKTVTLAAGGTASALLRITQAENYPATRCNPVASDYLQIYPPNQTTPIYLAYKSTGCSATSVNLLSIGVVQAGNGG
jgi:Domain of unknown function (DUF4232)